MQLRSLAIWHVKKKIDITANALDLFGKALLSFLGEQLKWHLDEFELGMMVQHSSHGSGQIERVNVDDQRGKAVKVLFLNGETHLVIIPVAVQIIN